MGGWKKTGRKGTVNNQMSLVLKFTYSKRSWLFFGDLEGEGPYKELLETKDQLKTDVMMLPHHGAHLNLNTGSTRDYYQELATAGM